MRVFRPLGLFAVPLLAWPLAAFGQRPAPAPDANGLRPVSNEVQLRPVMPETIEPSWDTRSDARTLYFDIPAPRGQITDRNGLPLAQSRLGYHLDLSFPPGDELTDTQVVNFAKAQLVVAQTALRRKVELTTADLLDHYHNRRMLPMDIATYLTPEEVESVRPKLDANLLLRPVYLRFYPNGALAAHIIGYSGKTMNQARGPVQPNELLWPDLEGREGLEKTFNDQLTGKPGLLNMTFDGKGNKTSERIVSPPIPGNNVVTTLDLHLQQLCEQTLAKGCKRGAIVMMDPNTGDVLAMASWPTFNPNLFVPSISEADFKRINEDPDIPLIPRAFRASYPPGSTFKCIVGTAALQTRTITKDDQFTGPSSMYIGNILFHNWKKTDAGDLNFVQALAQSCDTWFYQVGIKVGPEKIADFARRFGLGQKTGLPLRDETAGLVPDNDYMKRVHKRKFYDGDTANFSIGQGDVEVTPIQNAQAMAALANGGTLYQTRLVQQVQNVDNEIAAAYQVRARRDVGISPDVFATLKKAMVMVVEHGTAAQARVPNVEVAGKTGTAQWGAGNNDKGKSRTAWWFAGIRPRGQTPVRVRLAGRGRSRRQAAQQRDGGAGRRQGAAGDSTRARSRPRSTRRRRKKDDDDDDNGDDTPSPDNKKKDKDKPEFEQDMQDSD